MSEVTASIDRKKVLKETINMAWPSVLEGMLVVVAGMVDTYMVSSMGRAQVSAIGITGQPKYFVFSAFFAVNTAVSLLVARRVGEKRQDDANRLFLAGMVYVLGLGALLSILCVIFAEPLMVFCGANEDSKEIAARYFQIVMGGSLFNLISLYINAAQRGSGRTRIAMTTNVTSNLVNVVLNYLLIGGHLGFPALGVDGAAIATVAGTAVAAVMSFVSICRKDSFINVKYIISNKIRPCVDNAKTLSKIGITILGELLLTRVGFTINSVIAAKLGTDPNAAHHTGMNFMNLGFGFGDGLQVAAVALVGRSLGEKNESLARAYVSCAQRIGFYTASFTSLMLLIFARPIYNAYYPGVEHMLVYGQLICMFIAVIMPIQVSKIIYNGALRGAGDVKFTLFASSFSVTLIQPILAQFLIQFLGWGLYGVWTSILVSQLLQFILFGLRFKSGKWRDKKV